MAEMTGNPFKPSFGQLPPHLVGRDDLLSNVRSTLSAGPGRPEFTSLVLGARGTGKTVCLLAIRDEAEAAGWRVIQREALVPEAGDEVASGIADDCLDALEAIDPPPKRRLTDIGILKLLSLRWEHRAARPADLQKLLSGLVAATQAEGGAGVILIIDEFHNMRVKDASRIASVLQRITKDQGRPLAFFGAGLPHIEYTLLPDKGFTFFQRCYRQDIERVSHSDALKAVVLPLQELNVPIDMERLKLAVAAAQGYPFGLQSLGFHMWEQAGAPHNDITAEHIDAAVELMREEVARKVSVPTWNRLSAVDRRFLGAMARDDGPSRSADIARRLDVDGRYVSTYRKRLLNEGVVVAADRGLLAFANPMLRDLALEHAEEERAMEEARRSYPVKSSRSAARCDAWMPRSEARCIRPENHTGPHRSQ